MSRAVSQTLLDAISNQQGETILRVKTWADLAAYNLAPTVPERTWQTNKFKIEATEAEAHLITDNDYTLSDFTVFIIERGATISGVEYVVQSGIYFVSSYIETDGRLKIKGSSFPDQKIIIAGDDTYENVITAFCTEIGKTAVFKDTGAAWLGYQFLPAGKQVILNKAERFLNLIRQKYLILCYERGPKELVFYHATTEQSVWKDIIYADSQLVLAATSGSHEIARSTDGTAYTKIQAPSFVNSIAYSPTLDLFATVGNGVCITSPDGITWTSRTIGSNNWTGIVWDSINGRFVAISDEALFVVISGTILPYTAISTDGVSWTTYSYGAPNRTNTYQSIAYGNSIYAIVGNSSNCSSSTDGSAWSNRTIPAGDYKKLIYADGLFVAVGASKCATSPDGITWTERTIPAGTWLGLAYSSTLDLFVAVGDNLLCTSPDGITWTTRTAIADQAWQAVTWSDTLAAFYAVASEGDNRIASSEDGINWQILTTQADYSFSYLDGPTSSIEHGTNTVHFISRDETASVNTSGNTDYPAWNLGYLESTDSAPGTNSDPFYKFFLQKAPLRLDVTDGDRIHFEPSWVLDPTKAIDAMIIIVEAFDSTKSPAWYQEIRSLALFDSVEGGSLPSTIERVAAYTPLVSSGFDGNLTPEVNNLQALAEAVDDLTVGSTPAWGGITGTLADQTDLQTALDAKEDTANKATTMTGNTTSNIVFLTAKAIYDWAVGLFSQIGHTHTGLVTNGDSHDHSGGDGAQIAYSSLSGTPTIREVLTANRTYYVRTDGSDSNNGLTNTAGGAFLTIQKAVDIVAGLDLSVYDVTIQVGNGTYTGAVTLKTLTGAGLVTIQGDDTTPANVIISTTSASCFTADGIIGRWRISGVELRTTTSGHCVSVIGGTVTVTLGKNRYGACANSHIILQLGASVYLDQSYTISGNAERHWNVLAGLLQNLTITVTLSGTPNFSSQFLLAERISYIRCNATSFSGAATGTRYLVQSNAVVFTNGGGATFLPGNAAGSTATGGQYI